MRFDPIFRWSPACIIRNEGIRWREESPFLTIGIVGSLDRNVPLTSLFGAPSVASADSCPLFVEDCRRYAFLRECRSLCRCLFCQRLETDDYHARPDYGKAFDWGVTATVGIEVKRWFFRLGYDISLGNEYGEGISPKYHVGTISIGYKF